ncbi:hypothetical protein [Streptomyces mirabilis]|uniref:hypothetical protein n=1 Tax=Streptomyces mirabilis TaxID=68239 RepID=UPI0022507A40|nr:hypothetical protein [Streptomyces mirabilis]MCX4430289.1 hypothetical protein [Streptomyces mirabilis]
MPAEDSDHHVDNEVGGAGFVRMLADPPNAAASGFHRETDCVDYRAVADGRIVTPYVAHEIFVLENLQEDTADFYSPN